MPCKCGSLTHKRTTHKDCPLRNRSHSSQSSSSEESSEESESDMEMEPWVVEPSLETMYPELYRECLKPNAAVQAMVVDIVSSIVCGPDVYTLALTHAKSLLAEIASIREQEKLSDVAERAEDIADMVFGAFLGSIGAPRIKVKSIVENMPDIELDPNKTFRELVQHCYDTTKLPAFKDAVRASEERPISVLYAIEMWQQYKGSEKIQDALKEYSRRLYNKSMRNVSVDINF